MNKKDNIEKHLDSAAHKSLLAKWRQQKQTQASIVASFNKAAETGSSATRLSAQVEAYRLYVCEVFLANGIPINKLDSSENLGQLSLPQLLRQPTHYDLGSRQAISSFIPLALEKEIAAIVDEIKPLEDGKSPHDHLIAMGRPLAVFFDGATKVCEIYCVMCRFCTADGHIQQRVLALTHLEHSADTSALASVLSQTLQDFSVHASQVVAFVHDRVAVNIAAMSALRGFFPGVSSIGCYSHTINNAGGKIRYHEAEIERNGEIITVAQGLNEHVDEFLSLWINLVSRSTKARNIFSQRIKPGVSLLRPNFTRWYTTYEVIAQLCSIFPEIHLFLKTLQTELVAKEIVKKALQLFTDHEVEIGTQLSAVKDAFLPLVRACYRLEGDGFLSPATFDEAQELKTHIQRLMNMTTHELELSEWPHARPYIDRNSKNNDNTTNTEMYQRLVRLARLCTFPGLRYLHDRMFVSKADNLSSSLQNVFLPCRLCNPYRINFIANDSKTISSLLAKFAFLTEDFRDIDFITPLLQELPRYLSLAEALPRPSDATMLNATTMGDLIAKFWRANREPLPYWSRLAFTCALMQPSSACVERTFSMVDSVFGDDRTQALEDYRLASIMLRYNTLQRGRLRPQQL